MSSNSSCTHSIYSRSQFVCLSHGNGKFSYVLHVFRVKSSFIEVSTHSPCMILCKACSCAAFAFGGYTYCNLSGTIRVQLFSFLRGQSQSDQQNRRKKAYPKKPLGSFFCANIISKKSNNMSEVNIRKQALLFYQIRMGITKKS